jgi:hypothetical protein
MQSRNYVPIIQVIVQPFCPSFRTLFGFMLIRFVGNPYIFPVSLLTVYAFYITFSSLCSHCNISSLGLHFQSSARVKNIKMIICLTKHYAKKTYGEMDVQIHVFLTSALVGGGWSDSRHDRFILGERAPSTLWIGVWIGSRAVLDDMEKLKCFTLPEFHLRPLGCPARCQSLYRLLSIVVVSNFKLLCHQSNRLSFSYIRFWEILLLACILSD